MAEIISNAPDAGSKSSAGKTSNDGLLRDGWYLACTSKELKKRSMFRREILGEPILLGRTKTGEVFALKDICPHRAAPLSAGEQTEIDGEPTIECPYHGWRFGHDGVCKAIPSLVDEQSFETERIKVRAFPLSEAQGLIWIYVAIDAKFSGEPAMPAPYFERAASPQPKLIESRIFKSHMDHAVVGLMDPAHGPYVHQQWWWRSKKSAKEKQKAFEPREMGFAMARHVPSSNSRAYKILGGEPTTEITFKLPGMRWEDIENKRYQVLALTCLTPINENETRITQVFYWNMPLLSLIRPFFRQGVKAFLGQDGGMVDLQNEGLKYDPRLLWIDDADVQAKWYHTLKKEWAASKKEKREFNNPIKSRVLKWRS